MSTGQIRETLLLLNEVLQIAQRDGRRLVNAALTKVPDRTLDRRLRRMKESGECIRSLGGVSKILSAMKQLIRELHRREPSRRSFN